MVVLRELALFIIQQAACQLQKTPEICETGAQSTNDM
jgi:hypothetical protein